MKKVLAILFLIGVSTCLDAQIVYYDKIIPQPDTIMTGTIHDGLKYKISSFTFIYKQIGETIFLKVINDITKDTIFNKTQPKDDSFRLKPSFFGPERGDYPIVLMLDPETEFSGGQYVYLIYSNLVFYSGFMNYAVNLDNGESIANYCRIKNENGKLLMDFNNVGIFDWDDIKNIMQGQYIEFEITKDKIVKHAL